MPFNLNTVMLAGHLTRDPQVRALAKERSVASFSIAINRRFKGADGEAREDTTFVDCEAWGRTAELVGQYLVKGSACYIEGRLKLDTWDAKDGTKRSRLQVVADSVQFLGRPKSKDQDQDGSAPRAEEATATPGSSVASQLMGVSASDEPPF